MIPKATLAKLNVFCYPKNLLKKDWQPLLCANYQVDFWHPAFFFNLLNLPSILREIPSLRGTLNSSTVLNVRTKCIVMPVLKKMHMFYYSSMYQFVILQVPCICKWWPSSANISHWYLRTTLWMARWPAELAWFEYITSIPSLLPFLRGLEVRDPQFLDVTWI